MPYIAPEVITEAKRMDLLTYLREYEPGELVKFSSNTYTTRTHDSLKISNGKWMWWSRGIGGKSALDYLIKVRGMDFVQAFRPLWETVQSAFRLAKISKAMRNSLCFCPKKVLRPMWYLITFSGVGLIMKSSTTVWNRS